MATNTKPVPAPFTDSDTVVEETGATVNEPKTRGPRVKSDFAVVKEVPPPAPNSVSGGQLFQALEEVMKNPGDWFRVAGCNSRSGANSILSTIKKGTRKTPAPWDHFEFTARAERGEDTSRLYARYVGASEK